MIQQPRNPEKKITRTTDKVATKEVSTKCKTKAKSKSNENTMSKKKKRNNRNI